MPEICGVRHPLVLPRQSEGLATRD